MVKKQSKSLAKTDSKALNKKNKSLSADEFKKRIAENFKYPVHSPDDLFGKVHELYLKQLDCNKKKNEQIIKEMQKYSADIVRTLSLETNHFLISAVDEIYKSFALEFSDNLKKEFDIKTPSEKALAQTTTLSFIHYLKYSNLWNVNIDFQRENESMLAVLSKEIDRSYRRFITTLQLLSQMKNPPLKINVKAENAYMAQNQQINNPNPVDNETNKQ